MLIQNRYLYRIAAFSLAIFGLHVFFKGVKTEEYKVLDDGSLINTSDGNLVCFRHSKTVLTFKTGFDIYRSIGYGISSVLILLDLILNSGHLTLPALALTGGEIVNDFSDFCLAVFLIGMYIGVYPAAAYGLTYLGLLAVEVIIWLGTCKFLESCRIASFEKKFIQLRDELLQEKIKKS